MIKSRLTGSLMCGAAMLAGAAACFAGPSDEAAAKANKIAPATLARVGTVDERFQSYNIETVEVTGGRFWKSFASIDKMKAEDKSKAPEITAPGGMNPSLYEYRPPIDLSKCAPAQAGCGVGPCVCARKRDVDEFDLLSGFGCACSRDTAGGLQQRVDAGRVEGRG